jgi:transcriptional regulator with XRE-family HTH domain
MEVVDRIVALMAEKNVSAIVLSAEIGLAKNTISEWKIGRIKPSTEHVAKIADFFNVSTDYLLGRTDTPGSPLDIPSVLSGVAVAFPGGAVEDLTQDEVDKLAEFARFLLSQRKERA